MAESFVTILFTDLVGSASLFERHGDEAADAVRRRHFEMLRRAVAEHGGREIKSTGDGLMVAFPSAVSAVRCAVNMQRATAAADGGLELRVGLEAGEPLSEGDDLYGTPVIIASRLCDIAGAGEILASEVVCKIAGPRVSELIQPVGTLKLRGTGERVAAAQVRWRDGLQTASADPQPPALPREILVVVFRTCPDVVLMDIRMPELDGLKAAEGILSNPELDTAVLMLTTFDRDEYIYRALRIGASGFLLKDAPADRLLDAVRVAAAGDALLAPSVTRRLIEQFARGGNAEPGTVPAKLAELTPRELEVLQLVARGLSNGEIAAELVLGENTIKTHVAHLLGKLGLRDRVQAVVLAYETGFVAADLSLDQSDSGGAPA